MDRSKGMQKICTELIKREINLSELDALDIFARKGDWQTFIYADKVKTLELWELNKDFEVHLKTNFPSSQIKITNSIEEIKKKQKKNYNFIVIDNPQGVFGQNNEYCEHFDIFPYISNIIKKKTIIIFNINKQPFNYEGFPEWKKRRDFFYNTRKTDNLSIEFLLKHYKDYFFKLKLSTVFCFNILREECKPDNYLHYFVFLIKTTNN